MLALENEALQQAASDTLNLLSVFTGFTIAVFNEVEVLFGAGSEN